MTEDQRAKWKQALAAKAAQQRRQRYGPRARGVRIIKGHTFTGAGMIRLPVQAHDDGMDARPRCTMRGCPVRYRGGPDRPCPEHDSQPDTHMLNLIGVDIGVDGDHQASTEGSEGGRQAG